MWTLNINEEKKLLILRISDTLTLNELSEFLKEIYDENDGKFATYNRFADLSDLKDIKIDFDTFSLRIHEYRRCINLKNPIKISLFISPGIQRITPSWMAQSGGLGTCTG